MNATLRLNTLSEPVAHPSLCRWQKRRLSIGLFICSGAGTQTCQRHCCGEGKACCLASLPSCPSGKQLHSVPLQKQRNCRSSHDTQPHPLIICLFPPRWLGRERLLLVTKWQTKERRKRWGAVPKSEERLDGKIFP